MKSKRRSASNEQQQQNRINPSEGLIPVTNITPDMPFDQRESICKNHTGSLKATCTYDKEMVKSLLRYYPIDQTVNLQNDYGWTPLMWACKNGQSDLVKLFLEQPSVDINLQDKVDRSALTYALSEKERTEIVELLLARPEIDISLEDKWKDTAIKLAYKARLLDVTRTLLKKGAKVNDQYLLVKATQDNLLDFVELFLEFKAMPNMFDSEGSSALCEAARTGSIVLVTLLIKHNADINIVDHKNGSTPMIYATKKGNYEIVSTLLQHGANPNIRERGAGKTALWYAVSLNRPEIAELIRSYGGQF
ncbi:MAG: ankyrin repeat domain-containing protein [Oligoflexia bacterium]|nr:ankyrin repeat domain-containing protein [Oligoflexia bacterium]